jgi:hypothetical protein
MLYARITARLREASIASDPDIRDLFEFLIAGFYDEYMAWNPSGAYFTLFRSARFKALSLVAHAYFHMGYDLPRTIASAIEAQPSLEVFAPNRNRARREFLRLNEVFRKVFAENSTNRELNGILGVVARLPLVKSIVPNFAYWTVQMRDAAWMHAEMIADEPVDSRKRQMESAIHDCVLGAGAELARRKWNPVLWLTVLPAPTAILLLRLRTGGAATGPEYTFVVCVAILAIWVVYLLLAHRGLRKATAELGRHISNGLEELLPPEYRDRLTLLRRLAAEGESGAGGPATAL